MMPQCGKALADEELIRVLNNNQSLTTNTIRNCILLTIALFSTAHNGVDLEGIDVRELSNLDKEEVFAAVNAAIT